MRAVQVTSLDGPDSVEISEIDEPTARPGQVLIDVHAAGVNFPDVLQTRGEYQIKPPLPFVPGSEVTGVVRSDAAGFVAGQRVAAFAMLGGYAETVAAEPDMVFPLPDNVDFVHGAALPMNYLTVHFALQRRGHLKKGETVLVQGAAGGIGTAAIQFAVAHGAQVIAVVSTPEKAEVAKAAGAHETVLADGFLGAVKALTGGRGVDIVVDPVGGDRFTDSLRSLATEGRLLVIGFTGRSIPEVKVNRLLLNNTSVVGVGWGAFWFSGREYVAEQWGDIQPLLESGALDPPIGATYPLEQAAAAIKDLDERRATGKIVLTVR